MATIDVSMAALTPIKIDTVAAHGLSTDDIVVIMGVVGNDNANGTFTITVVDADSFTLNDTVSSGIGSGGTVTLVTALTVTAASNAIPIAITTSGAHSLLTGYRVIISDVLGNTATNGTWTITKVDATHFTLDDSYGNGAYTSGGTVTQTQSDVGGNPELPQATVGTTSAGPGAMTVAGDLLGDSMYCTSDMQVLYQIWGVSLSGDPSGEWEIGIGTFFHALNQLGRDFVIASSTTSNGGFNGEAGAIVDFSGGVKFVTLTALAEAPLPSTS